MLTDIAAFLLDCRARGLASKTLIWYAGNLNLFARFCARPVRKISIEHLRAFVAYLQARELSVATIRGYVRTLKIFFQWCAQEECIIDDPTRRLALPRMPRRIPRGIAREDFRALVAAANVRDRAMLYFLADTGCRVSELCGVKVRDIREGVVQVRGKGGQERFLFLKDSTRGVLLAWLRSRKNESEFVFSLSNGRAFSPATVRGILLRLKARAGVSGRCNAHSFRHGFAREWLLSGGDLASLSDVLGHRDIATTKIYAAFGRDDLRQKHVRHSALV